MMRIPPLALAAVVIGAGSIAVLHAESAVAPVAAVTAVEHASAIAPASPSSQLPPNHPVIHAGDSTAGSLAAPTEGPSITWNVPAGWKVLPNPNAMRLATYVVKSADGEAEVTVSRAGGSTDANIERWIGQFDEAGKETRAIKTIHGVKLSTVEVGGTYRGGMGGDGAAKPGWAMYGAIAEAPGTPYFFKMTGTKAGVRAARASFDALVASITPS